MYKMINHARVMYVGRLMWIHRAEGAVQSTV